MLPIQTIKKLFPSFEPALAETLAEKGEIRDVLAGQMLMKTGQHIRSTMLVLSGLVKVFREDDEGGEFFMYYLQPGQACALSMVCATRRETSEIMARAVTDSEILTVPLDFMDEWMLKYKTWYHFVLETYRNRFEELLHTVDHIAFRNLDERLVFYLRRYQESRKTNVISTSFTEIAQDLNSSREVISRLMKKLSEKGMVQLHRSHVEILDLDKLL